MIQSSVWYKCTRISRIWIQWLLIDPSEAIVEAPTALVVLVDEKDFASTSPRPSLWISGHKYAVPRHPIATLSGIYSSCRIADIDSWIIKNFFGPASRLRPVGHDSIVAYPSH